MAGRKPDRQRTGLWQPALRADRGPGGRNGHHCRDGGNGRPSHRRHAVQRVVQAGALRLAGRRTAQHGAVLYLELSVIRPARANGRSQAAAGSATDPSNRSPRRHRTGHAVLVLRNELLRRRSSRPHGSGGAQQPGVLAVRQFRPDLGRWEPVLQQGPQGAADHCRASPVGRGLQVRRASRAMDAGAHPVD